jgi:hypothetical protein
LRPIECTELKNIELHVMRNRAKIMAEETCVWREHGAKERDDVATGKRETANRERVQGRKRLQSESKTQGEETAS